MNETSKSNETSNEAPKGEDILSKEAGNFDPDVAKARVEAYKKEHPDAVEDVDKARRMAEAGDEHETEALSYLHDAEELLDRHGNTTYGFGNDDLVKKHSGIRDKMSTYGFDTLTLAEEEFRKANAAERKAGEAYDEEQRRRKMVEFVRQNRRMPRDGEK